jgi:glycosyltransferase involved in cell wall biosynthesis
MNDKSLVSAVIPTYNRPRLVLGAVKSALSQTHSNMEVIVVLDGPDNSTSEALGAIGDSRIRIITLAQHQGACGARNAGIQAANGEWIAFLDDDDEWLPRKIELQLSAALRSAHRIPVVSCRMIARTPRGDYVWPRRFPAPEEPISEYLFSRKGLFCDEGVIATPMLFTKRELLLQHPFRQGLRRHQDADWVLRVARQEGVGFEFEPNTLAICLVEQTHPGISNSDDWRSALSWIEDVRQCITLKAYASFILLNVAAQAAPAANTREYWKLLEQAIRRGEAKPVHVLLYVGMRLIPRRVRRELRGLFGRIQ